MADDYNKHKREQQRALDAIKRHLSNDEVAVVRECVKYFVGSECFLRKDLVAFARLLEESAVKSDNEKQAMLFCLMKQSILDHINNAQWRKNALEETIYKNYGC